jgi:hypothetical protein
MAGVTHVTDKKAGARKNDHSGDRGNSCVKNAELNAPSGQLSALSALSIQPACFVGSARPSFESAIFPEWEWCRYKVGGTQRKRPWQPYTPFSRRRLEGVSSGYWTPPVKRPSGLASH